MSLGSKTTSAAPQGAASHRLLSGDDAFCEKAEAYERRAERGRASNLGRIFSRKQSDFKGKCSPSQEPLRRCVFATLRESLSTPKHLTQRRKGATPQRKTLIFSFALLLALYWRYIDRARGVKFDD